MKIFVPKYTGLHDFFGLERVTLYEKEIDLAVSHHKAMESLVTELPPNLRLLFIEMTRQGLAGHPKFTELPQIQRDLYRISHTGRAEPHLPSDTFRYMFGFQRNDPRFAVWNLMGGEEEPPLPLDHIDGVILSGSEMMVTEVARCSISSSKIAKVDAFLRKIDRYQVPVLGVCFSHQWIAHMFEGRVDWLTPADEEKICEVGPSPLQFTSSINDDVLLRGLESLWVQAYHYQGVMSLPRGAIGMASNHLTPHHVLRYADRPWWTMQGHPELTGIFGDIARTIHGLPCEDRAWRETHGIREILFPRFLNWVRDYRSRRSL